MWKRKKNAIINCHNNSNHHECSSIGEDDFVDAGAKQHTHTHHMIARDGMKRERI